MDKTKNNGKIYTINFASHGDMTEYLALREEERLISEKEGASKFVKSILRDKETLESCRFGYEFDQSELKKYLLEKLKIFETKE